MNCENIYCIYCKNNKCTIKDVSLDIQGICQDCIYVTIDSEVLQKYKDEQLKLYDAE